MHRNALLAGACLLSCLLVGPALAKEGSLEVEFRSAPYSTESFLGQTRIEMEGFDDLKRPGHPLLPEKHSLFLLPPGARVVSLEIDAVASEELPGSFRIAPTPPLLPAPGAPEVSGAAGPALAQWQAERREAYASDQAYPARVARVAGSGTLRKYSYVRVAFSPFTYHAASGRLVHHEKASVRVHYTVPEAGSQDAERHSELLLDTVADGQAARLFDNFDALKALYDPELAGKTSADSGRALHDYVIITTPENAAAVSASGFVDWKTTLGFNVRTVLTSDPEIGDQTGADLAERIRDFLRAHYATWGIEHVLLVGDYVDIPMRYCYPDPENHLHDPWDPGVGPGSVPTDAYYADLSYPDAESWDLDGDGFYGEYEQDAPGFMADVNVGRIPTSQAARITYTLDKIVRFEQDTGAWKREALHAGAVLFFENQDGSERPFRDGAVCLDEIESDFMQEWSVSRYSEREGIVTSTYDWPTLTLQDFIGDWNSGTYGFVNWAGHGWPDGVYRTVWWWDDGDGVPETDGQDGMESVAFIRDWPLLEDDYPSIVCAVSCDVAYPEPNSSGGNLGINLLTEPSRGAAAAVMASTRYAAVSRDWPAIKGGAETLCYEFNHYAIAGPEGHLPLGAAVHESKYFAHAHHAFENNYEYRNFYNYNLYGDPSMDWRGAGEHRANLLRSTDLTQTSPPEPGLDSVLPLDPVEDLYMADFVSGGEDPDSASGCPLVYYEIDAPVWLWLTKTPGGGVQLDF